MKYGSLTCFEKKLDYKYYGFFIIQKYIGLHTYSLELLNTFHKIYHVFHVYFLESYDIIEGQALFFLPLVEGNNE